MIRIYTLSLKNGHYDLLDRTFVSIKGTMADAIQMLACEHTDRYVLGGFPGEHDGYTTADIVTRLIDAGGVVVSRFHYVNHLWNGTFLLCQGHA